ncbi:MULTISPECIES: putative type VI secretion system effector [Xanthomonas translucens group]|uniref:putative type VI secretion system effector n=1 Tax=Xanthomonas translucens group TaxID=3390202 RepID=UPI0005797421|nr:putative type VI secretion system effector [Xanthomonas translucens]QEO26506.1 hypothetical protein F0H32_10200 [Xanthomonas translucens pv. undulosa]UKE45832.1 hypothetical protein KHA79_11640 [Xanthomonas translucens pv. cerealis]
MQNVDISAAPRLLRGKLSAVKTSRTTIDFFFGQSDERLMEGTAVAAAAMGLSGAAAAMTGAALDETKEDVLRVEFTIDGERIEGVFWSFPFQEGDELEAVVESTQQGWIAFAVARPCDRIVAIYPYAWAGTIAHYKRSFSVAWKVILAIVFFGTATMVLLTLLDWKEKSPEIIKMIFLGGGCFSLILAVIAFNLSRRLLPFSEMADRIFATLKLDAPKWVNLRQSTLRNRTPEDPPELGDQYFRY